MIFWENLKIFYLVVKYNSFALAADFLKLHTSSVTRPILSLERELKEKLFINKKKIQLTAFGIKIFNYIKEACHQLLEVEPAWTPPINPIRIYISDSYFYNVLLHLYEKNHLNKKKIDINNISIIEDSYIQHFMENKFNNFLYISSENLNTSYYPDYISLPIYSIPVFLYEHKGSEDCFFMYDGCETWLKIKHQEYTNKNSFKKIIYSNSLDIISKLIHGGGKTLLPVLYADYHGTIKKVEKVHEQKLFFTFHKDNDILKSFLSSHLSQ